jgi:hypothetical protein
MAKSPIPVRLTEEDERALALIPGNRSDILRRGIHLQAASWAPLVPLYAHDVSEPHIQTAIEEAAAAACERLDELFGGAPKESGGIGSNFQGVLVEHLAAMLTGREAARQNYSRQINPLFGDWATFGRDQSCGAKEGFTIMQVPERLDGERLFYNDDRKAFVPLDQACAGALFSGQEYAVAAAYKWLREEGISPRERQLRVCILSFADDGPLKVARISAT